MNEILFKEELAPKIKLFDVTAPIVAEKAEPGQFVMIRVAEDGERFPLTIAGADPDQGSIRVAVKEVGKSSRQLGEFEEGDELSDLLGPLGLPYDIEDFGTVLCFGGSVYAVPMHYMASVMREAGNEVITVLGARVDDKLVYEEELDNVSDELYVCTDDGSEGFEGLDFVDEEILSEKSIDRAVGMGRISSLKKLAKLTEPYDVDTIVSLTPIMVDGTGMCGSCRVIVGGETKFACIDGPKFDAHEVDWDLLSSRKRLFSHHERTAAVVEEECKLEKMEEEK